MQNLGCYKICKKLIQFTAILFGCKCSILCIGIFLWKKGSKPILKLLQLLQREWLECVELQREEMDCFQIEQLQSSWKLQREIEIAFKESGGSPYESSEL